MENSISGKKLLSGAIALLLAIAVLLGLTALDRSLPAAEPAAEAAGETEGPADPDEQNEADAEPNDASLES